MDLHSEVVLLPTEEEKSLLLRLLDATFPGRDELVPQLENVLVKTIDQDGGLELQTQAEGKAPVVKQIPLEAEGQDEDGVTIHMLLYVVEGKPIELGFFKDDGTRIRRLPPPSRFDLIVLPPVP